MSDQVTPMDLSDNVEPAFDESQKKAFILQALRMFQTAFKMDSSVWQYPYMIAKLLIKLSKEPEVWFYSAGFKFNLGRPC